MIIHRCSVKDVFEAPNWGDIVAAYAAESPVTAILPPNIDQEAYYTMEKMGILAAFAAIEENTLVGFAFVVVVKLFHFSIVAANTDAIFMLKEFRSAHGGKLVNAVECYANEMNCSGLTISAPIGSSLVKSLTKRRYTPMNVMFLKKLNV